MYIWGRKLTKGSRLPMACARGETVGIAGDFAGVPTFQAGDLKPADFGSNERAVPQYPNRGLLFCILIPSLLHRLLNFQNSLT